MARMLSVKQNIVGDFPRINSSDMIAHRKLLVKLQSKTCVICTQKFLTGSSCDKLPGLLPGTYCLMCHAELPHTCADRPMPGGIIRLMNNTMIVECSPIAGGIDGGSYREEKRKGADM